MKIASSSSRWAQAYATTPENIDFKELSQEPGRWGDPEQDCWFWEQRKVRQAWAEEQVLTPRRRKKTTKKEVKDKKNLLYWLTFPLQNGDRDTFAEGRPRTGWRKGREEWGEERHQRWRQGVWHPWAPQQVVLNFFSFQLLSGKQNFGQKFQTLVKWLIVAIVGIIWWWVTGSLLLKVSWSGGDGAS